MNNLKRVLSLALSGIMLVGMMAIGAGAAEFTDADKIEHDDAVNILVSLKVINGQDDGSFNPEGDVTRAQMAKMIAVAMNGGKDTNTGVKTTATFTDIKGHWAESYIEYCADMGIISGRGDGTFDPEGKVTGLEAAKMVLTALGYDSTAYQLTGATWAVRTDELSKKADPALYEDLDDVSMANKASRDTAAQLIWNGLQNDVVRVTPNTNTSSGETTWTYNIKTGITLLEERYNANIVIGTFTGNYNNDAATVEGDIHVTGKIQDAADESDKTSFSGDFPSDFDISHIGEEVKVIYKNTKDSIVKGPDKNDTIYGVFPTGKSQVVWATKNDVAGLKSKDAKIKVAGAEYNCEDTIDVFTNYVTTPTSDDISTKGADKDSKSPLTTLLNKQSADQIKLILKDGKVESIYVVEQNISKVTGTTASKITIQGVGAIDLAKNDVYEGAAKDDVVVYTKLFSGDKALYTVEKAETVEGKLTSFKKDDNGNYVNLGLDGKSYLTNYAQGSTKTSFDNLTDDEIQTPSNDDLQNEVRLYLVGGMVGAIQSLEVGEKNWAIIIDKDVTDANINANINPNRITVLFADGTEETLAVHKDSKVDGTNKFDKDTTGKKPSELLKEGNLVEYSLAGGKIKIEQVVENDDQNLVGANATVWDSDTKEMKYSQNTRSGGSVTGTVKTARAAADSIIFVCVDNDGVTGPSAGDDYYVYDLRSLGDIKEGAVANTIQATAHLNGKGLINVATALLAGKPSGATDATVYGIISKDSVGNVKVNDEYYTESTVVVNGETFVINTKESFKKGDIVTFEQTSDNCYDNGKVTKLADTAKVVAVDGYNEAKRLLTFYDYTVEVENNKFDGRSFANGVKPDSATADKDVKIVYVDTDNNTSGAEDFGVSTYDITTGKANAMIVDSNNDGLIDVIVVETSGAGFSAVGFGGNAGSTEVGGKDADGNPITVATALSGKKDGVYTFDADTNISALGFNASVTADKLFVILYTTAEGDTDDFTLTIKDSSGAVKYAEKLGTTATAEKQYKIWIANMDQSGLASASDSNVTTSLTAPLSGVYTWEITKTGGSATDPVKASGTLQF